MCYINYGNRAVSGKKNTILLSTIWLCSNEAYLGFDVKTIVWIFVQIDDHTTHVKGTMLKLKARTHTDTNQRVHDGGKAL